MARRGKDLLLSSLSFLLFFSPSASSCESTTVNDINSSSLRRTDFPDGFIFGASSSAYQYEGGAREGGRGPAIWDTFTHQYPEKIRDQSNGDVALDSYHRYKEDVMLLKGMGMDTYRFSISWSRILPNGSLSGGINAEGIKYYNNLINFILHNGLTPFVTILHFDTPQGLDDAYGSFLSKNIVKDFSDYAEICFREFGDRVKHWVTINEPYIYSVFGYAKGVTAPGRCSPSVNTKCTGGESGTEPYGVGHNILLAHAAVVKLYRKKYNKGPNKGVIGITMMVHWFVPLDDSKSSSESAGRALDFMYGWFMDPLTEGDYPFIMRSIAGNRLPKFTKEESEMIKGSFDFIGINYYTAKYVSSLPLLKIPKPTYQFDSYTNTTAFRNGKPIGPRAASLWLNIYPPGLKELLLYTKIKYNNPTIYITENGVDEVNNVDLALEEAVDDDMRLKSYKEHLHYVVQAMSLGVDVRGFFTWSLLDNFEWAEGYTVRFGLFYVDYKDGLKRYPKKSALWFKSFLKPPIKLMETM